MPEPAAPETPGDATGKAQPAAPAAAPAPPEAAAGAAAAGAAATGGAAAAAPPRSASRVARGPAPVDTGNPDRPFASSGILWDSSRSAPDGFVWDAKVFDQETPDYLIPRMDQRAVSTPTYFQRLLIHDPGADVTGHTMNIETDSGGVQAVPTPWGETIEQPLDPFQPLDAVPLPGQPVFGALVSFEQGWFEKGLALGRLLHSTCLAPGEVTKIAVTSFHRQSAGRSSEDATQQDRLESATDNASAVAETQSAVSHELKTGVASNFSLANQTQAGASGGGLLFSASGSVANNLAMGLTTAVASAATDFKAEGAKQVSQSTVAASQAVRARRASQVRETSEDESQTGQTRVIANYNHMHALTMMFFEVLQCFSLETRVIDAKRVIFIPMQDMAFTPQTVSTYSEVLRTILIEQDLPDAVAMLDGFLKEDLAALETEEDLALEKLTPFVDTLRAGGRNLVSAQYPDFTGVMAWVDKAIAEQTAQVASRTPAAEQGDEGARNAIRNLETSIAFFTEGRASLARFFEAHARFVQARRILPLLEAHRLAFNQHMWMRMDASRVQRLVHRKAVEVDGKRLALEKLMDPRPIGVFGNFVAFRLPQLTNADSVAFAQTYITPPGPGNAVAASIVLPSGGLFGEAVLGQAISAEKIDLTRFWNWQDSPIPILPPELSPLGMASRARDVAFSPVAMEASIVELIKQVEPSFTSPAELAKSVVAKVSEAMVAGQGALQAAQVGQVGAGATAVGEQNVRLQKQAQDFAVAALNSQAAQAAIGMVAPGSQSATMVGGLLGANKPSGGGAGIIPGGQGAAETVLKGLGTVAEFVGKGTLTPPPV